jgi:hypothetical protein
MRRQLGCALPQPGSYRSPVDNRCLRHSGLLSSADLSGG